MDLQELLDRAERAQRECFTLIAATYVSVSQIQEMVEASRRLMLESRQTLEELTTQKRA